MSNEVGAIRGTTSAKQIRRARAKRLVLNFAIWVGLPTMCAVVYYGFWATAQYESTAVFTVQSNKGSAGSLDGLSALPRTAWRRPSRRPQPPRLTQPFWRCQNCALVGGGDH